MKSTQMYTVHLLRHIAGGASAEDKAVRSVRNRAVEVAIAAAADSVARTMGASDANKFIDTAIGEVERRLH